MTTPRCCLWEMRFTGQAIPALPGQQAVLVIVDHAEDSEKITLHRAPVQAWGTYVERLVRDGHAVSRCPECGDSSHPDDRVYELQPMILGDGDCLVSAVDHGPLTGWSENVEYVGLFRPDEAPSPNLVASATKTARDRLARLRQEAKAAQVAAGQ